MGIQNKMFCYFPKLRKRNMFLANAIAYIENFTLGSKNRKTLMEQRFLTINIDCFFNVF
jgi:hypothetical protein